MGRWYWERLAASIALTAAAVVVMLLTFGQGPGFAVAVVLGVASVVVCPTPP